ncbi:hypothetical protein CROQUDRAFT_110442 [Cronartium quercuum f. sp. fusiforme G11]|uniref:Uncharacterized protein n=1 Tax=Cronartium quercuum f. sp. fusiforme G11 TaxID=708437 RepID=A0A9P6N7T3_9BASI|nr:hypothetical protein CROQUDRAFT_110442 [Cronartium quercuum f. sp. fusiforme G11]
MPHTNSRERNRSRATKGTKKFGPKSSSASILTKSSRSAAVYDDAARHEYLTGFSTRKKAAKLAAQQRTLKRAREEKLEIRRQLKAARLAKVKENVEEQAEWYGGMFSPYQSQRTQ